MLKFMKKFRRDEEGATAIEYGLIAALVAIALITALNGLGTSLDGMFTGVSDTLDANAPAAAPAPAPAP
ncbi:MAG: Flp family type IVb pilin [Kordiimonadaceae bacterium]|nr:Flp family type IVb pilin [Kordiimonadaceae bacterium]MBO6569629.1 Flp family type IVb pilin [Kordiimonadaceae bacterium]MBO6966164.1 Flp family type IVb pilin [Kordiimonadaceae bacterium]